MQLGGCYLQGLGTKQNLKKGVEWMRKSAHKGNAKAQYNLGSAYLDGEGVRQNVKLAQLWLRKAAGQGHRQAANKLKRDS